jgi:flagellar biosynthesis chaperone FliJ
MKRFSFRLERVLQLRRAAEQEQARALTEARRQEEERRRAAEESAARFALTVRQLSGTPTDLRTAGTLSNLMLTLEVAEAAAAAASALHREAVTQVDVELAGFDQARQARRAIERLREHRHSDWQQEVSRAEQQEIDEVASRLPRTSRDSR